MDGPLEFVTLSSAEAVGTPDDDEFMRDSIISATLAKMG